METYLPLIIAGCAIFGFGLCLLAYGIRNAQPDPDEAHSHEIEDDIQHGPDGSSDNGTRSR